MKEIKKNIFALILLVLFPCAFSYPQKTEFVLLIEKDKVIHDFHTKQSGVNTISSTFKQIRYIAYLAASIESTGKFFFKKENSIRWEYLEPYQYSIILNEGKLRIESNNDDIRYKMRKNKYIEKINEIIQNSFYGNIFSDVNYDAILEENYDQYRLTLIPKNKDTKSIISKVYLHFNKQTLSVSSIIIHEPSKDFTSILFTDQVFNLPIDNNTFR